MTLHSIGRGFQVLALAATVASIANVSVAFSSNTDTLTVITLNLWHDQHDWPKRLERIVRELRQIRPDVVCLQEVSQNPNLPNQANTLAESLGCHVQFASVDGPERPKRYGNAILTPHRVVTSGERNLEPANDYRAVAHVRLACRGREIDAYSTHLHHTPEGGAIRSDTDSSSAGLCGFHARRRTRGAGWGLQRRAGGARDG